MVEAEAAWIGTTVGNLDKIDDLRFWSSASLNTLEVDEELVSIKDWETSLDKAEDPKEDCGVIGASDSGVSGARLSLSVEPDV